LGYSPGGWGRDSPSYPILGGKRRDEVLDEVSTAILADAVGKNKGFTSFCVTSKKECYTATIK
jgi:hypothetical protein